MPTRRLAASFATTAAALLFGVAACSSTATIDPGDAGVSEASSACTAYATALCQKGDACTGGRWSAQRFADQATCVKREALACSAALGAPDSSSGAAFFKACSSALTAGSCDDFFNQVVAPACLPAAGARALGAACSFNAQCQSTWCRNAPGAACGACADRPPAGAPCTADSECGGRGLTCSKTNVCVGLAPAGAACDDARPCAYGTACIGQTKAAPGVCVQSATTVGAACDPKRDTGASCQGTLGLYCSIEGKCAAEASAAAGQACGRVNLADGGAAPLPPPPDAGPGDGGKDPKAPDVATCGAGGSCVTPAGKSGGTCVAPAADGSACDRELGPPCLNPARCVLTSEAGTAGTCVLPSPTACR